MLRLIRAALAPLALLAAAPAALPAQQEAAAGATTRGGTPVVGLSVVARFPHDPAAFTQGLLWEGGALYESTGKEGRSVVRRVRLADGKVLAEAHVPAAEFGEGLALWKHELVSLTWHEGVAHRWDQRTLKHLKDQHYPGEGWGLTSDGRSLILSDGTPALRFMDPATFRETRRVTITLDGRPLTEVNEIEWVDGAVLGNVWQTGFIVRIDPATGRVTQVIDARALVAEVHAADPDAVLNGIAWDAGAHRLFLTGKLWPTLFEVKLDS